MTGRKGARRDAPAATRGDATAVEQARVSMRMLFFVADLLRETGVDPRELSADLPSFRGRDDVPELISWSDYIELINRLGRIAGGPAGIARAMRATLKTSYSELRALSGFFAGPVPFFSFVNTQLMPTMTPGAAAEIEVLGDNRVRYRTWIKDGLDGSELYFHGTVTLVEVFPTHFGLPEARVEVLSLTDRALELIAEFPAASTSVSWGDRAGRLRPREREVLRFASEGRSPGEIASAIGGPPRDVQTAFESLMAKMDAVNREALEQHESLRDAVRRAVVSLESAAGAASAEATDAAGAPDATDAQGWSFLDQFEVGGRRFVIAMRNDVDVLSDREREVLGHAAIGLHDKAIAYELGVAAATVRVLLHRAAKKLGVRGRREAVARFVKVRGVAPDAARTENES